MSHAPADCKGQGSCFCSGTNDCEQTVERETWKTPVATHTPVPPGHKRVTTWTGSHWRELSSSVMGMPRCGSPQLLASSEGVGRKGPSFWGGEPLGVWPWSSEHVGNSNGTCFLFYLGGRVVTRVGEQTWEGWEMSVLGYMMWNSWRINKNIRLRKSSLQRECDWGRT